jgi:hypothetical protein
MTFIDFSGRSIPLVDAGSLDTSFIPAYEKQLVAPNTPATDNFSKRVVQSVSTLNEATAIGQLPPYPSITVVPKSIGVESSRTSVNNVKGISQTPVASENDSAVIKDA